MIRVLYSAVMIFVMASMLMTIPAAAQEPIQNLRLQISTERPSFSLGEPVYLTVRLVNEGPNEIRLLALLNPKDDLLGISIRDPAGQGVGFVPLSALDRDASLTMLAPKMEIGAVVPVFFGATGWVFQVPGQFVAVARFDVHTGPGEPRLIQSPPLSITIRDEFADGARFLMDGEEGLEAGRFLVWRSGDQLEQGLERLRQYAERYPTSPVVDHYHFALGRSWARPFKDYRKGAVRPANYERALMELDLVRDDVLPASLRVEKYLAQATSFLSTDRGREAAQSLHQAKSLIEERVELAQFREQLTRLERHLERLVSQQHQKQ
jgi:hypothetical protein